MASFPSHLASAARSAYRSVLRAARITFNGDSAARTALQNAARQTSSSPTLTTPQPSSSSSASITEVSDDDLAKRIDEWREVAMFLRRNVVQGVQGEKGAFRLRVTPDTELGDNAAIRDPPKLPVTPFPNRSRRKPESSGS